MGEIATPVIYPESNMRVAYVYNITMECATPNVDIWYKFTSLRNPWPQELPKETWEGDPHPGRYNGTKYTEPFNHPSGYVLTARAFERETEEYSDVVRRLYTPNQFWQRPYMSGHLCETMRWINEIEGEGYLKYVEAWFQVGPQGIDDAQLIGVAKPVASYTYTFASPGNNRVWVYNRDGRELEAWDIPSIFPQGWPETQAFGIYRLYDEVDAVLGPRNQITVGDDGDVYIGYVAKAGYEDPDYMLTQYGVEQYRANGDFVRRYILFDGELDYLSGGISFVAVHGNDLVVLRPPMYIRIVREGFGYHVIVPGEMARFDTRTGYKIWGKQQPDRLCEDLGDACDGEALFANEHGIFQSARGEYREEESGQIIELTGIVIRDWEGNPLLIKENQYPWRDDPQTMQTVWIQGSPTGGSFRLSFFGFLTDPLLHDVDSGTMKSTLEAHPNIGTGNVSVTGTNPFFRVSFVGALAEENLPLMELGANHLTGGSDPTVEIEEYRTPHHTIGGAAVLFQVGKILVAEYNFDQDQSWGRLEVDPHYLLINAWPEQVYDPELNKWHTEWQWYELGPWRYPYLSGWDKTGALIEVGYPPVVVDEDAGYVHVQRRPGIVSKDGGFAVFEFVPPTEWRAYKPGGGVVNIGRFPQDEALADAGGYLFDQCIYDARVAFQSVFDNTGWYRIEYERIWWPEMARYVYYDMAVHWRLKNAIDPFYSFMRTMTAWSLYGHQEAMFDDYFATHWAMENISNKLTEDITIGQIWELTKWLVEPPYGNQYRWLTRLVPNDPSEYWA